MECNEPTQAATPMADGRFGSAITLCGPVINAAMAKHLAYEAGGSAPVDWILVPIFRSGAMQTKLDHHLRDRT